MAIFPPRRSRRLAFSVTLPWQTEFSAGILQVLNGHFDTEVPIAATKSPPGVILGGLRNEMHQPEAPACCRRLRGDAARPPTG